MKIKHLLLFVGLAVALGQNAGAEQSPDLAEDAAADVAQDAPEDLAEDFAEDAIDPYAPISAWAVCPPQPERDYDLTFTGDPGQAPTYLKGDFAERDKQGRLTLIGDAEAERGYQRLRAERIIYSEADATVDALGPVTYDEPLLNITGTNGKFWIDEHRGQMFDTRFWFYDRHGRGTARKAYIIRPGVTRFKKALYTTCPEDSNAWIMRATKVTLDENEGEGVARNARLSIKGVPVLYTPYISFPIDDRRKTGFLVPSFGTSDNSGLEIKTPFYWNIAPNYDALITPRYLADRGTQLNTEFRFLQPKQDGLVRVEYLHNDDITDDKRSRVIVRNDIRFNRNLTASIDYDRVSDKDYLVDLGDSLSLASVTHLRRTGQVNYTTSWYQAGVQIDDYQTVDKSIAQQDRPYQRLPRATFQADSPLRPVGLESRIESEFVRFDADQRVTADRIDLWPSISRPFRGAAFDSTPKVGFRYTAYKLDNQAVDLSDSQTRSTPFFSFDNVVYFERDLSIGGGNLTQTLEPRIFYLWVKGTNQEDLPLFDASTPTFNYNELFEENRFNGVDRMGDANQAALALTTRVIDPANGSERLRASIGQLRYFANRNVTLNNTAPLTESKSDIAAELEMALSRSWTGKADLIWDPDGNSPDRGNARVQYNPGFRKIANLSYRYIKGSQNQVDASFLWPLSPSWHVLGRWYYDIGDSQKLETLAGIEYDSCCWGIRFVTRDYIDSDSKANNRVYMAQIALKGLATFGSKIESILEDGILGYSERPIN